LASVDALLFCGRWEEVVVTRKKFLGVFAYDGAASVTGKALVKVEAARIREQMWVKDNIVACLGRLRRGGWVLEMVGVARFEVRLLHWSL
jgi:hypothetical protein